jgi:acyl carrier protein
MNKQTAPEPTAEAISAWLVDWLSREIPMPAEEIDTTASVLDYSLSSVTATILVGDLEDWLGLELSPTLVWDFPTIDEITAHLLEQIGVQRAGSAAPAEAPVAAAARGDAEDAEALLANLDQMSDAEVDALLARLGGDVGGR